MDDELRTELLAMVEDDQRVRLALSQEGERDEVFRREWLQRTDPEHSVIGVLDWDPEMAPAVVREMWDVDRRHLERMRDVTAQHGWPGKSLVGRDGAHAAWLLVLHADVDRGFQRRCLEWLRQALAAGEAEPHQVAWLTDRLLMAERREQYYGTILLEREGKFVPFRLADPEGVDERRRKLGMPPLADDIQRRSGGIWP